MSLARNSAHRRQPNPSKYGWLAAKEQGLRDPLRELLIGSKGGAPTQSKHFAARAGSREPLSITVISARHCDIDRGNTPDFHGPPFASFWPLCDSIRNKANLFDASFSRTELQARVSFFSIEKQHHNRPTNRARRIFLPNLRWQERRPLFCSPPAHARSSLVGSRPETLQSFTAISPINTLPYTSYITPISQWH